MIKNVRPKHRAKIEFRRGIWHCYGIFGCFGYGKTPYDAWQMYDKCIKGIKFDK